MNDNSKDLTFHSFKFNGQGGEYFKIWIVNLVLSILTLGIYSAWAKVRTTGYIYSNFNYQQNHFDYLATGMMIFKSRIFVLLFFVLYVVATQFYPLESLGFTAILFLLFPWAYYKSLRFNARMMRYRNVRFNFKGTVGGAYGVFMGWGTLMIITGGLLLPLFLQKQFSYTINNFYYGDKKFNNKTTAGLLYKIYFKFMGFILLAILIMVLIGVAVSSQMTTLSEDDTLALTVAGLAFFYFLLFLSIPYFAAAIPNVIFPNTDIDNKHKFNSQYTMGGFLKIYLTYGLLMIITLGFAWPWFKMALLKYRATNASLAITGDLSDITDNIKQTDSAIGDEFGDAFFE